MEWFVAVIVIVALGAAALVAAGGLGQMSRDPVRDVYRQDLPPVTTPLSAADLQRLRFAVVLRGYAMAQVDEVLDRLTREVAERDARIAELAGSTGERAADTLSRCDGSEEVEQGADGSATCPDRHADQSAPAASSARSAADPE